MQLQEYMNIPVPCLSAKQEDLNEIFVCSAGSRLKTQPIFQAVLSHTAENSLAVPAEWHHHHAAGCSVTAHLFASPGWGVLC